MHGEKRRKREVGRVKESGIGTTKREGEKRRKMGK
jgi:hypothetical protein